MSVTLRRVGWALAQQQSVALHLTSNGALRALLGQGPTYIYIENQRPPLKNGAINIINCCPRTFATFSDCRILGRGCMQF